MAMDVVDYEIKGAEMQFVEVELDPGEAAIGEAGSMMFMDAGIEMDTVFGDGSAARAAACSASCSAPASAWSPASRCSPRSTRNDGARKQRVAFAAPYPGKILPMDLRQLGGTLICQKDAFLCAARGVVARHRLPAQAVGRLLRRRGLHHAEARRRRPGLRARRRHRAQARAAGRARRCSSTPAASSPCTPSVELRDPVRRQDQDRAVRRRGPVLRQGHRPGHGLAAEPAVLAPGLARVRGGAAARRLARGRLGARRPARSAACSAASSAATTSSRLTAFRSARPVPRRRTAPCRREAPTPRSGASAGRRHGPGRRSGAAARRPAAGRAPGRGRRPW